MRKIYLQRPDVGEDELKLVQDVLYSNNLVEGKMVRELEAMIAKFVGVEHATACTSGTIGLELALRAVGIKPLDEIIVPDFTHPATALVVRTLLAHPVLVDVDLESYNVTKETLEKAITKKTKAIMPVSLFGNPLDMTEIMRMADAYRLPVIEDAACCLGSEYCERKVGSHADLSVFSFHPRKVFTTGEGGVIVTDNEEYYRDIESMKQFGIDSSGKFADWGTNYRMNDILGAVALGQIRRIHEILDERRTQAYYYDILLKEVEGIRIPKIQTDSKSNYQTYCIYIEGDNRDNVMRGMRNKGIETQIGTYALHELPVFKDTKRVGNLRNSSKLYRNLLALPLHHKLAESDQERVIDTLKELL